MMVPFQYRLLTAAMAAALSAPAAWAADGGHDEQDYFQEFPVVLSASRLKQPMSEAPNAMTVIDREMIAASGFRNIADLFRLVPGMYVGYHKGSAPLVTYHGATDQYSRRMQVLVDGRTVYLPPMGGIDWLDIPLSIEDLERIEVIRGPAAASHGSNSLQGVISITTRDAASIEGAKVSLTQGDAGINDVSARLGKRGEYLDYRITLASRKDDGYDLRVMNDGSTTNQMNLRANYRFSAQDSLDVQLGYSEGTRGTGNSLRAGDPFRDTQDSSDLQQLSWLHSLSEGDELNLHYYHIGRDHRDKSPLLIDKWEYQVNRYELGLQHQLSLGQANRLVWGANARRDTAVDPLSFKSPQALNTYQVFAHDEIRFGPSFLANLGTMYEDDGMGHQNWSPRASLNYHVTQKHTLRAGASVAYRTPVMFEQYANTSYLSGSAQFRNLRSLNPEKIISKEIGYLAESKETGISLDMRIYQDRIADYIYLDPQTPSSAGFTNLFSTEIRGTEITAKYQWGRGSNLVLNYANQRASCWHSGPLTLLTSPIPAYRIWITGKLNDVITQCPLMVPSESGSALLTQQLTPKLQFNAGYYHQEQVQVIDAQWPQSPMRRVDLRMAYAFGKQGSPGGGEIAAVVQDAFRDGYSEYSNVRQKAGFIFNRRAWLTVTLGF